MVKKMIGIVAGVLAVVLGAWTAAGYVSTKGIETPGYEVVEEKEGYEIRRYEGFIRAKVTVEGEFDKSRGRGFRKVADYIFGNNTPKSKIAMTAPVLTQPGDSGQAGGTDDSEQASQKIEMTAPVLQERLGEGKYTVAFVMPGKYTMETLPEPGNPEVQLEKVEPVTFAVTTFGGYARAKRVEEKIESLRKQLEKDGLTPEGPPVIAQYDPPWTPPYMRTNEIWFAVDMP